MEAITKVLLHICTCIAALFDLTIKAIYRLINLYSYFLLLFFFYHFHINKSIALFFLDILHIQITSILYALVNKFNKENINTSITSLNHHLLKSCYSMLFTSKPGSGWVILFVVNSNGSTCFISSSIFTVLLLISSETTALLQI